MVPEDFISPWILRQGAEELCEPLAAMFNKPFERGQLLYVWEIANIKQKSNIKLKASVTDIHSI